MIYHQRPSAATVYYAARPKGRALRCGPLTYVAAVPVRPNKPAPLAVDARPAGY